MRRNSSNRGRAAPAASADDENNQALWPRRAGDLHALPKAQSGRFGQGRVSYSIRVTQGGVDGRLAADA